VKCGNTQKICSKIKNENITGKNIHAQTLTNGVQMI